MSKQQERSKKKVAIISLVIITGLVLLSLGSIFGLKAYHKHQENKIYSVGETMSYPDFKIEVTKAETKPVDLPIKKELVKKYGGLENKENCNKFSKAATMTHMGSPELVPYGPSDYNLCIRRNNSRDAIKKYSEANQQLVVDYKITANEAVSTSQIKIELIPDSGRKLNEQVDSLNCNEFIDPSTFDFDDSLISNTDCFEYIPFFQSEIGENLSKELTRSGYLYTDVRNSENTADFILTYNKDGKTHTRTMRVQL